MSEESTAPESPASRKDPIWKNFTETDINGRKRAVCKTCNKDFLPKCSAVKKHWEVHQATETSSADEPSNKIPKKSISVNRTTQIDEAFSNVLAIPALSINTFLHPEMCSFLSLLNPNYKIPKSHKTLKSKLLRRCQDIKAETMKLISSMKMRPSITCDVWVDASNRHSYLGVTMHLCQKGQLKRIFLGLKELEHSHTGAYIRSQTEAVLAEYDISLFDIYKVVTDNGSNMLSAYQSIEQLSTTSGYEDVNEDDEYDFSWIDGFNDWPDESILIQAFPQRVSCFAHGLQLVISRLFKEKVVHTEAFKKMIKVVNKFKHSHVLTKELADQSGKVVLAPSTTRWGSIIAVLKRFLELKENIYEVVGKKCPLPSTEEILWLEEVHKICSPLVTVLSRIQGEKSVTVSLVVEYLKTLFFMLETANDDEQSIPHFLRKLLSERYSMVLNKDLVAFDPIFIIATSLDPRTAACLDDQELKCAAEWIFQTLPAEHSIRTEATENERGDANSTLDGLISRMKETNRCARRNENASSRSKSWIMNALYRVQTSGASNPLQYWTALLETEFHNLAIYAIEVLSMPATSAPIERVFSGAGLATTNRRNRTEFQLLNAQLVVNCNANIID